MALYAFASSARTVADLAALDSTCVTLGIPWKLDVLVDLTGASGNTTYSAQIIPAGGSFKLGAHNLTIQPITYENSNQYSQLFYQTGAGQIFFSSLAEVSPCWWGANYQGSTNSADQVTTREAFQYAEIAIDANPPSIVRIPPGHFRLDATIAVRFRNSHHFGTKGATRISFDPTTVPSISPTPPTGYTTAALFTNANPSSGANYPQKNTSFIGGSSSQATNCSFVGAFDPTTISFGLIWSGIDMVSEAFQTYSGLYLGANKLLFGLYLDGCFDLLVEKSKFIGFPNDGLVLWQSSGTVINCEFGLSGFYGGAASGDSSRNGMSFTGWFDLLTGALISDKISIINCKSYCNANSSFAPGGFCNDMLVLGCTTFGDGTIAIEHILYYGDSITQWQRSTTVSLTNLMYVPGATTGKPANLGGNVYQCIIAGTTDSSGTGPTGTGTSITDGSVKWQWIGYMPANGQLPATIQRANNVCDGVIPAMVDIPYLGIVSVPSAIVGNGVNGGTAWALNSANENTFVSRDEIFRNYGYTGNTSCVSSAAIRNGGCLSISGMLYDNCYETVGDMLNINIAMLNFGAGANNKARVIIDGIRFKNPGGTATFSGLIGMHGNINSYDIQRVDADPSPLYYGVIVEHAQSAMSILESGRIANCRFNGTAERAIVLSWTTSGSSVTDGIDLESNEFYGINSGASDSFGMVVQNASSGTLPATIRLRNNKMSFAAKTQFPIALQNVTGGVTFEAHDNWLNEGAWKLNFGNGAPTVFAGTTGITRLTVKNNGIPGDKETYGTGAPVSDTWFQGDRNWRQNFSAMSVAMDGCTASGTLSGPLSGCDVTISSGSDHGTYTGTPPMPGDIVAFTGGSPAGLYYVTRADSGIIYFSVPVSSGATKLQSAMRLQPSQL